MALTKKCVFANTVKAAEALKANRFVDLSGEYPDAAGDYAYGVTVSDAKNGESVSVDVLGTSIVQAESAVAVGAQLMVAAPGAANVDGGKVKTATANEVVVGRAITAATAADQLIEIALIPN